MTQTTSAPTLTDLLFDEADVGLCLVAPDGTVVRANREWLRSTGFNEEQVVGENVVELFPETRDMALALHARARAGHRVDVPRHAEAVNGRETWWEGSIEPVAMDGGTGLLITAREIGREPGLPGDLVHVAEGSDLVGPVLDVIGNLVVVLDEQGRIVRFNRACELATGYCASEVIGRTVFDAFVPFDEVMGVKATFDQLRAGDFPNVHQNRWRAKDGSYRLIDWANTCAVDDDGNVLYVVGTGTDVTDRAVDRRAAELQAVLDAVPAAVFITRDRDARSMDANRFCAELLRVPLHTNVSKSADAAQGNNFRAMKDGVEIPPEELPVQRAAARGEYVRGYEFDLVFDDGTVRHLLGNATPLDTIGGAVGAFLDVTALRESEQRFRLLTEAMPQIVCVLAPDGTTEYVNGAWIRFSGLDADATARAGWTLIVHPDDVAAAFDCRRRALKQLTPQDVELRYRAADGTYRWFLSRLAPVVANGRAVRLVGAAMDIDARKRAEQALRESEREARARAAETEAILGAITDGVLVYDSAGAIMRSNPAAREMLQLSDDVSALPVTERIPRHYRIWSEDGRLLRPEEVPAIRAVRGEVVRGQVVRVQSGDDEPRWMRISASPLQGGRTCAVLSMTDVTDRKRAETRIRRIYDADLLGMMLWTIEGGVTDCNDRFLAMTGYTREDLNAGRINWAAMTPLEWWPRDELARQEVRETGAHRTYEKVWVRKDGSRVPILIGAAAFDEGRSEGISFALDITDRKRVEEALRVREADLARAQAAAHLGSWRWDLVRDTVSWSDELYRIFGVDPATFVPSNDAVRERIHADDRDRHAHYVGMALAGTPVDAFESRIIRPDGEQRVVLASGFDLERDDSGDATAVFGTILDITDRKRMEDALRDADRRKTEFLGVLSHELRNPLAPIRNSIYLLDRAPSGSDQAKRAKEVIRRQTEHLTRLVEDLLDVTRIARGKIALQKARLDLRDVARKTASDFHSLFEQARIALRVDHGFTPLWVDADPTRIQQIIGNVLQNAIKFTPAGGTVALSLAAAGDAAVLAIRDDGVGIEPGMLPRVFDAFAQAEQSLARTNGGLGLGLSLVKGLVELHGGTVEARSGGVGAGTEIVISLPLIADAFVPQPPKIESVPTRSRSILVIEDNLDAGQSLADLLELAGHRVTVERDARSGIEATRELRPDVVLCDIGLPDLDGYEVARALRRDDALRGTRLIAVTGYAQPEDLQRALEAGFDAHLAKPMDLDELERALE